MDMLKERERFIIKAGMGCAMAMADYARAGYEDYPEVGEALVKCMQQITDKLDIENQVAFASWLLHKTDETTKEIDEMSKRFGSD